MHINCFHCLIEQANKLLLKYQLPEEEGHKILSRFRFYIERNREKELSAPEASGFLHREIKKRICADDLYKQEKDFYNRLLMDYEPKIRQEISRSKDPFLLALRYSLAGNVIDFGPPKSFDLGKALREAASKELAVDDAELLRDELNKADTVLYLGDNAGEIVLDKLFIEQINHPGLVFATRGQPVINDVTMEDARQVGMDRLVPVISNGYDVPSTLPGQCSLQFQELFQRADLIISKGQGNLEGLIDNNEKKIFFLLMVKCRVIGERIGAAEQSPVVYCNQR
ncbi:MAG: DUF89 domain-containing protein [Mangrovibacterium sp.]